MSFKAQDTIERKCPWCNVWLNKTAECGRVQHKQKPGDISICFKCGGTSIVLGNRELERLSKQTWDSLPIEVQMSVINARARLGKGGDPYHKEQQTS